MGKSFGIRAGNIQLLGGAMAALLAGCAVDTQGEPGGHAAASQAATASQGTTTTAAPTSGDALAGAPASFSLLVVTDSSLTSAAQPLIDFKNANGTPAFMTTMQAIRGAPCSLAVCDDAARLKLTIQRAYEQHGAMYVMLLGDLQYVPTRPVAGIATPTLPLPAGTEMTVYWQLADLYYANLYAGHNPGNPQQHGAFSDWRDPATGFYDTGYGTGDNNVNNPSHVDGYPDVSVGRVPAQSTADVSTYVTKVIAYESGQLTPASSAPYEWIADVGYPTSDTMINGVVASSGLPANRQTFVQVNNSGGAYGPPWQGAAWAETKDISDVFNNAWWVTYVGHGYAYGLDGWGVTELSQLANTTNVPIVYAAACQTAEFGPYLAMGYTLTYVDPSGAPHGYILDDPHGQATDQDQNNQVLKYPMTPAPMAIYQPHQLAGRSVASQAIFATSGGAPSGAVAWIGDTIVDQDGHPAEEEGYALQGCQARLGDRILAGQRGYWSAHQTTADWFQAPRLYLTTQELTGDPSLRLPACQRTEPAPTPSLSWATTGGANPALPPGAFVVGSSADGTQKQYACFVSGAVGQFVPGSNVGCLTGPSYTGGYSILVDDRVTPGDNPAAWQVHTGDVVPANAMLAPGGNQGICRAQVNGAGPWLAGAYSTHSASTCNVVNPTFSASSFQVLVSQTSKRAPDDLVWQNSGTAQIGLWQMTTAGSIGTYAYPSARFPAPYPLNATTTLLGTGDFDGDGHGDLAFRDSANGNVSVWKLDGTSTILRNDPFQVQGTSFTPKGVGDFDGDGLADILWLNTSTHDVTVALGNGQALARTVLVQSALPAVWAIQATGDFNGDGTTDILVRNVVSGDVSIWLMQNGAIASKVTPQTGVTPNWVIQGAGDFNGDRVTDVLWRDTSTGDVGIWVMDRTASIASYAYPQRAVESFWVINATGDFNGDGVTDIAWRNTQNGDAAMWLMNRSASIQSYVYPQSGVEAAWQIKGAVGELTPGQ